MTSAVSLLEELIRIDSTNAAPLCDERNCRTGAERAMARFVSDWLAERGFGVETREVAPTRPCVIGRSRPVRDGQPTVALEAHLDTVGVEGMRMAPFEPRREDGRIYGRGAADTKGALAAMLSALEALASEDLPVNLMFIGACAEETGCEGIARLDLQQWPDAAIVGEPTSNRPVATHKGFVWFDATVGGRAGHSSDPDSADNAVVRACRVIEFLRQWAGQRLSKLCNADFDRSTLSVNRIAGGTKVNVSPADCTFSVDIRLVPGTSGEDVLDALRDALSGEFTFPVELRNVRIAPGLCRREDGKMAGALRDGAEEVTGGSNEPGAVHYCSDAGVLQQRGVDCAVFGPGNISQAHGKEEWVSTEEVREAADILRRSVLIYLKQRAR